MTNEEVGIALMDEIARLLHVDTGDEGDALNIESDAKSAHSYPGRFGELVRGIVADEIKKAMNDGASRAEQG